MSDASPSAPLVHDVAIRHGRFGQMVLYGLVILLGSCFGLQYAAARMMGLEGVEPFGALLVIHLGLSAIFLAGLALAGKLFRPSLQQVCFFTVIAFFTNLGQFGLELSASHHLPAGELTLIMSLLPVFVLMIVAGFRTEPLTARKATGLLLGVAASSAILLPSAIHGHAQLFWVCLTFAAPILQAIGVVLMYRFWPGMLDPMQVATGTLLSGTLLLLPFAVLSGGTALPPADAGGQGATLLFGLTMAGEFYIFAVLLRRGGAVLTSCADFIAVCAGLGFGYLLFGEVPTLVMSLAALLCLLALKFATDRPA